MRLQKCISGFRWIFYWIIAHFWTEMERSQKTEQCSNKEWQKRLPSVLQILAIDGKSARNVLRFMLFCWQKRAIRWTPTSSQWIAIAYNTTQIYHIARFNSFNMISCMLQAVWMNWRQFRHRWIMLRLISRPCQICLLSSQVQETNLIVEWQKVKFLLTAVRQSASNFMYFLEYFRNILLSAASNSSFYRKIRLVRAFKLRRCVANNHRPHPNYFPERLDLLPWNFALPDLNVKRLDE